LHMCHTASQSFLQIQKCMYTHLSPPTLSSFHR